MRRYLLTLAAIAASVSCVPGPASADVRTIEQSGLWSAYSGTATNNRPVCGITTVGPDGRRIAIDQFKGDVGLELSLVKDSWSIPPGTSIDLRVEFNRNQPIPLHGTGDGNAVHVPLTFDESVPFMHGLRTGQRLQVFFPAGNEPYWAGGLQGTARAIDAFDDCRAAMGPAAPTQPFAPAPSAVAPPPPPSAPTQPFGAAPSPPAPPASPPPAPATKQ